MARLVVRNIEEEIVHALKMRAARHGRSAEAEHREILHKALRPGRSSQTLKEILLAMPDVGKDTDFERVRDRGRRVGA